MKNIIHFSVSKEGKFYIASAINFAIITQARTLDDLAKNIQEAVEVHFHGENIKELGFSPKPSILANIELPAHV